VPYNVRIALLNLCVKLVKDKLDGKSKLKPLCETRWCIRANALATFKAAFPVIVSNLEYLQTSSII
jgi:hypothetical protein